MEGRETDLVSVYLDVFRREEKLKEEPQRRGSYKRERRGRSMRRV